MARRSYKNKTRSLQPAVMRLNFRIASISPDFTGYIDISECVSRLNRRFYRQGLNWAVGNIRLTTLAAQSTIVGAQSYVSSLPHTWTVANAWMKSYSLWKRQQDDALAESESHEAAGRFRDFKIFMEEGHHIGANLLAPISVGPGRFPMPGAQGLQTGP